MVLSPEIISLYILDVIFVLFATIAFYLSLKITLYYDVNATTSLQYRLQKSSYLSATIIQYILSLKIPLFLFFIFTLDKLSNIIHGAMCAAGIVDATEYGSYLLILKLLNLYLFAYWIVLHKEDIKHEEQPYTKLKFALFIGLYILLIAEIIIEVMMFSAIDTKSLVDCCGAIYSNASGSYIAQVVNMDTTLLLSFFYGLFFVMILSYRMKHKYSYSFLNLFFLIISIITLISFFGTYIYELPTHKCPFCFLQREYSYVGYLLYTFLFIGTFHGIALAFIEFSEQMQKRFYRVSLFFNSLYLGVVSAYPLSYFLTNGVWL